MDIELFKSEIEKLGIKYDEAMLSKLEKYYILLVTWNEKMNLTAITDKKTVYLKHFYDSLTITKVIDFNNINSLCDIGTGAGFPGLVLKIFFPHLDVTLVDSLNKRIIFLDEVIKELNLENVYTKHIRAEEYGKTVREKFDLVTARAVSSFNVLLEYAIPLVKNNKYFVAMRGNDDTKDGDKALKILSCLKIKTENFKLPIENSQRTIVVIQKKEKTKLKYPRKFSEIKKRPL
ncbi:MAG: 16S rRNA (guanine(527)-N(7))-methyltransferase RsmG [Bacilli bacterium]|nr:16S rRNA (guanine(527)-N(7))-methyltransferase RsmG [Bacilli bacterium]